MPVIVLVIFLIIILFCIAVLLFGIGYGAFRISRNTRHYFEVGKDGKCKDYTVVLEGKTKLQQKAGPVIFAVKKALLKIKERILHLLPKRKKEKKDITVN